MKTILLIEDDVVLRDCTTELLELSNYTVVKASNGKIGVELAKLKRPDIIVCDIMMPELDGYGVIKLLSKNKNTKSIPFIFLSAKTEVCDVRKGMNLGADDYISKPFAINDLINAIESRLAKVAILQDLATKSDTTKSVDIEDEIKTINDLKNYFDDYGSIFRYSKDQVIYNEGDHTNYIYLINKGAVKCHQIQEQGKELVTALYKEDDLFGYTSFTQNIPHKETVTAIDDTELTGVSVIEFNQILNNNHKLTIELMQLLSDNLIEIKKQLLEKAYASVNKKTATTILKFAEKINRKPDDPIKISRSDLASVAGIATETLIRALTEFKKLGIIKSEGRNIKVVDIEKLKQIY
ncbi:response regulator [Algibacter sp. L4_22]|uniref:response regulator n=1 Tax=Algibacter sp. L4_22 TaxID=2942477 RepID=UPI00201B88D8|nr:response regulator [Algibacter sp. L4_22]MCL5128269.1 response regulator [Algibacter sp. L4_22]